MKRYYMFLAAVLLAVGITGGVYAVSGIDFVEGTKIPGTLTADRTHSGANTFSGTNTLSGATTVSGTLATTSTTTLGDAAGDVVTVTGTMTAAQVVTATTGFSTTGYYRFGADPADAGAIRLSNGDDIMFEASAAGTDINALTVDASEVVQIGSSGAFGVTITPATTVSGALTASAAFSVGGHVTTVGAVPTADTGTIDVKSTDHAGVITAVSATSTIVTFAAAYTATPACVASAESPPTIVGLSTTGFTISAAGNLNTASYACWELL